MIAHRGLVLKNQEAWAQGVKISGAAIRGVEVYQAVQAPVNLLSTDINDWESGHYDQNGNKSPFVQRIRLINLWPVPNPRLYFNVNGPTNTFNFILRTYNSSQALVSNLGTVTNGYISNFAVNVAYLGISIYDSANTALTFADYQTMFTNGMINPWIGLA